MIGSVSQSENAPKITLSDFTEPEELLDKELDTRVIGTCAGATKPPCPLSAKREVSQPTWAWPSEKTRQEGGEKQGHDHILKFAHHLQPHEIGGKFPLN